MPVGILHS
jgi:hypothetical protein